MYFYGLRLEYDLEGIFNYIAWKDRMEAILEDNIMNEFIYNDIPKPTVADAQYLASSKKNVANARRILSEGVSYHIVSNLHG